MNSSGKTNVIASFITLAIIALLIAAGPAGALTLKVEHKGTEPFPQNSIIPIFAGLRLQPNEHLPIKNFSLYEEAEKQKANELCVFTVNGTILKGCKGMIIKVISQAKDSGYGFTDGTFLYNITLNVKENGLKFGSHKLSLVARTDSKFYLSPVDKIVIKP